LEIEWKEMSCKSSFLGLYPSSAAIWRGKRRRGRTSLIQCHGAAAATIVTPPLPLPLFSPPPPPPHLSKRHEGLAITVDISLIHFIGHKNQILLHTKLYNSFNILFTEELACTRGRVRQKVRVRVSRRGEG